jgi:hypothetical protein
MRELTKKFKQYCKNKFRKIIFFIIPDLNSVFPIDKIVRSIPEKILDKEINQHLIDMTVIRDACAEKYNYIENLPTSFRIDMHFARRHVYRLSDVCVNVKTGACCTDSHAFLESYGSLSRWLIAKPISRKDWCRVAIGTPATCINNTGYAHFVIEELPRLLWALKIYPDLHLIHPEIIPGYAREIYTELRERNILKYPCIAISEENLIVNDFVFTQSEAYSGFWHKLDIERLRKTFLIQEKEIDVKIKIYISRKNSNRSFCNENELEQVLALRGFKVVYREKMKFMEQIALFSKADIVVSPHGAGLANIVWCSKKTKIIEIFTTTVYNDCFSRLSSQLSCQYYCLWSGDLVRSGYIDPEIVFAILNKIG